MNLIVPNSPAALHQFNAAHQPQPDQVNARSLAAFLHTGNQLHKAGRLKDAEAIFRKILAQFPDHPVALLSLGIIAHQSGAREAAIALMTRAVEIAPDLPQAQNNLGNAHAAAKSYELAIVHFTKAVDLRPDYADAHFNLGVARRKQGQFDAALVAFGNCRQHTSNRADLYYEIGQCHTKLGNRFEAQVAFRTAMSIDPNHVEAHLGVGTILFLMGKTDDAEGEFRAALALEPNNLRALNGLSECIKRLGQFEQSLELLGKAIAIEPANLETLSNFATTYQSIGDNEKANHYYDRVLELSPNAESAEKGSLFVALNRPELSSDELFDLHLRLRGRHNRPEADRKTFSDRSRDPDRKLRIGYLSSDFRTHVVALNILPLLASHDHASFEIFLYSQEQSSDQLTEAFKKHGDHYKVVNRYSDADLAAEIERDEIDILVTLAGRFDENRPLVAAYRAAPIQVSFHDCATSGLQAMDYWLTDSLLHPHDTVEKFTEQLYRLPVYYQYPVQNALPPLSEAPALRNGFVTFGCFNKPEKINDDVVSLWAEILHSVPNSKLFLKYFSRYSEPSMRARWIQKFGDLGIEESRLILKAEKDKRAKHLSLYHDVDAALDPFPFNGATTTFEALSMGVPVISLIGRHFVDRVAASMVTHAGLAELAAKDRAEYVSIATSLAADLASLGAMRSTIRDKLHASPLCDGGTYAQTIERAFRDMWQTWCATGGYRGR